VATKKVALFFPTHRKDIFDRNRSIPTSLLYLERAIRHFDIDIILIDEQIDKSYADIIDPIKDDLLFVGISTMTGYQLNGAIEFSKYIRTVSECDIVWGGWHPTLLPEQVLDEDFVDYVVVGQGEIPLKEFTERKLDGKPVLDIAALGYKQNGEIIINPREDFKNPESVGGEIDYSKIDIRRYVHKPPYDAERCIDYMSSHGCPFKCGFCSMAVIYDRKWYGKNLDCIIKNLKYFKSYVNIDSVYFFDDNFFVNRIHTIELCKRLIDENLNLKWHSSAHAGLFLKSYNDDDIKLMYDSGCREIYIGAESGDQYVLDIISKETKVEDNLKFVEVLSKHGIIPRFAVMICLPMNPARDVELTFEMVKKAKLINPSLVVGISFYTPYPGTDLFDLACENGFTPPPH